MAVARWTKKRMLAAMEGKHHDKQPRYSRTGRAADEHRRIESAYMQGALPHHEFKMLIADLNDREQRG